MVTVHWILERRDALGQWHAVLSHASLDRHEIDDAALVAMSLRDIRDDLFQGLTDEASPENAFIDGWHPGPNALVRDGLPHDISRYALDLLSPSLNQGAARRASLRGHCHLDICDLPLDAKHSFCPDTTLLSATPSGARDNLDHFRQCLDMILPSSLASTEILTGAVASVLWKPNQHLDMEQRSRHEIIADRAKLHAMPPCTQDTSRLVMAFDE